MRARVVLVSAFLVSLSITPHVAKAQPADADPVALSSAQVAMIPQEPEEMRNGRLRYLGGLILRGDHRNFSGLSGLHFVHDDTAFLAVNDRGNWVSFAPQFNGERLSGIDELAHTWSILDETGAAVTDPAHDSESLAIIGDTFYVGFERTHRIDAFKNVLGGTNPAASPFRTPETFGAREFNGSLEALTAMDDTRLLAFAEASNSEGLHDGWIMDVASGISEEISLRAVEPFSLTDIALLPNGDLVTLERRYSPLSGVGARLRLIASADIVPGAILDGVELAQLGSRHSVDNMEGLAVREIDGRVELFMVSDNNQNPLQRNLLLAFELMDAE